MSGAGGSDRRGSASLRPVLTAEQRQRLIREGVGHFEAGRYYECHDAWEEVWRSNLGEPRDLFRGLIQIAVGFYHFFERGKPAVAARVIDRGRRRVEPYAPRCEGLGLATLLEDVAIWQSWLSAKALPMPADGGPADPSGEASNSDRAAADRGEDRLPADPRLPFAD